MMFDGGAVPAAPRWMWEAVTAVMFVRLSVQLITAPLSTNVAVPVPVVVLGGTSLAATRFATKPWQPDPCCHFHNSQQQGLLPPLRETPRLVVRISCACNLR